jgi:MFS transporter, DHA1 family, inner membrane transport protein
LAYGRSAIGNFPERGTVILSDSLTLATRPTPRQLAEQVGVATFSRLLFNTARRFPYPFAPALSQGLGVPLTDITTLIAINLATGLLSPVFGPFSDRWGYRTMLLLALAMLALGMLAAGLLPYYLVVMLALFLAGLGKSIFDPALQAYLGQMVPYHRRGLVIGVIEFGWSGSSLIGIPVMGLLIDRLGWQSPFWVLGLLSLLALGALALLIPAENHPAAITTPPLRLAETWQQLRGHPTALGLIAFSFLLGIANDNFFVVYGVWLESAFKLSLVTLGAATMVIGVAELLGDSLTATVADRVGLHRSIMTGLVICCLSYLLLPALGQTLPLALVSLFVLFVSFEFAVVTSISLATEVLPNARATMMAAYMATMSLGRVIGALIGGWLWQIGGLTAVCWLSTMMALLAMGSLWWGLRHWAESKSP